jgi:hypothetical protein
VAVEIEIFNGIQHVAISVKDVFDVNYLMILEWPT